MTERPEAISGIFKKNLLKRCTVKKLCLLIFMGVSLVFYAASHEEHMIDDCYNCYITKNNSVYFVDDASHPYKIEIADYISFTVLSQFYAKDKNNIYFF